MAHHGSPGIAVLVLAGVLTACEHKTPATSQPTAARPVAALPDTAHLVTLSPQDSLITAVATPSQSEDVSELQNLTFDDRTTVAPGVVVSYKSIPHPSTVIIHDPCDIKIDFTIRHSGHIIYRDTTSGCEYDLASLEPATREWYPHWIPAGRGAGQVLIAVATHVSLPISKRFFISDGHVTKIDTIPVFDEPARNLDQDSWLELAAYQTLTETWTDEQGREWQGYNPMLYYEVRPTGLVLDTALTRRKAIVQYGVFRGFEASEEIKVSTKKPE